MNSFERIFSKARKHVESRPTEYEILRNKDGSIIIRREFSTGNISEENTFSVGDWAEYDSYNLSYYGTIISITAKTITIKERYGDQKHRLDLATFAWRNYNFSIAKTLHENAGTSNYI